MLDVSFSFFLSVFNLGSQLFFFFLSFFRFGKFFTLFFFRDKKNRFYASVGAQVENTHKKTLDVDVRSRERSRERSTPLSSTTAAATKAVGVHVLSSVVVSGRSQKRPRVKFLVFCFLLPPRQGKVGISSVRFFSRQRREHERGPRL